MAMLPLRVLPMLLLAFGAQAQSLRTTVVPADAGVIIPPRGHSVPASPPAVAAMPAPPSAAPAPTLPVAAAPMGLALPTALVPLAAAALLGVGLPGGGGGASAPASTR